MCETKPSANAGPFMAAVVLVLAIAAAWAVSALSGVLAAVTVTILAVDAVAAAVTWRMIRYGRRMRPVRRPAARLVRAPYQLPAPPLAIEGPKVSHPFAEVDWMRRCAHLDHPQANRCYLPRKAHTVAAPVVAAVVPGARDGARVEA